MAGKKVLMVVAPEGFRDEECFEPKKVLEKSKIKVVIASKGNITEAKGKLGGTIKVDIDISKVNVSEYDAVVFVGGPGAETYFRDETAHKIAKQAVDLKRILGAICIAPVILAKAGLLTGKNATVFSSGRDELLRNGAEYTGEQVTVDGRIITANGPAAANAFGNALVSALKQ
jgi:protease I